MILSTPPVLAKPSLPTDDESTVGRRRDLNLTRTGLFLLILGQSFSAVAVVYDPLSVNPLLANLAIILPSLLGGILIILGRRSFGPRHSRYAVLGLVLYLLGYLVLVAALLHVFAFQLLFPEQPTQAAYIEILTVRIFVAASVAIITTGIVFYSYAVQRVVGRILLWLGWATALAALLLQGTGPAELEPGNIRITIGILELLSPILFIAAFLMASLQIHKTMKLDRPVA